MRRISYLIFILLFIPFLTGCGASPQKYLITFYDVKEPKTFHQTFASIDKRLKFHKGKFIVPPIHNQGRIANSALPKYTRRLPGNFISVARFETMNDLKAYTRSVHTNLKSNLVNTMVVASIFKPMPFMPDFPVIGSVPHKEEPAFILLNGITMNSMLNPLTVTRMMSYMNNNFDKLKELGVVMLASFQIDETLVGNYPYDMLFLTEWPSMKVFQTLHKNPDFIALAKRTRNKAFQQFAEDKGVIQLKQK